MTANHGARIKVTADGPDAEAAIGKIGELISGGFCEEIGPL
jgi:phosphotransferase system HPr-like phosphotransfer protein